ncbi:EscD/YscD/HrpQ family type III secretion system inner membrane ring protein [Deltaproteobacteria bacterium Smac51]|nr:EscD/YscD/HrpQ family type III secretion system inner membrane ring protein [Deltaproteobacteria bacterium Smac51]
MMAAAPTLTIEVRVLSGPNVGAALDVSEGLYILGSGDSCDFILADSTVAARHLSLNVQVDDSGSPRITASPLDAEVTLFGEPLPPEGRPLPEGEPLSLGFTALAWRPLNSDWGTVSLVPLGFAGAAEPAVPPPSKAPAQPVAGDEALVDIEALEAAELVMEDPVVRKRNRRGAGFWLGLVTALALLALLFYYPARQADNRENQAAALSALLEEGGFTGLSAAPGDEAVLVSGVVASDDELRAVSELLSGQPYRIYLKVRVDDDLVRAVREALGAHGFRAAVNRAPGREGLTVAAYMKDGRVEARAFGALARDLPDTLALTRRIVYADEVESKLSRALNEAGLYDVEREYLDNLVRLAATLEFSQLERLETVLDEVRNDLKTPVEFQLVDAKGQPTAAQPVLVRAGEPAAIAPPGDDRPASPLGGHSIVGVTLSPMRFISMRDGQKYFEGAVLPGGYVIEEIKADEIILSKNNLLTTYKLGASDE